MVRVSAKIATHDGNQVKYLTIFHYFDPLLRRPEARPKSQRWPGHPGIRPGQLFERQADGGKRSILDTVQGATYRFVSAQNQNEFVKNPDNYTPEYGGWYAYAMADGDKVSIDPETFKIIDKKLYLF